MANTDIRPNVQIRAVRPADIHFLCDFLQAGFAKSRISARGWRALFDYAWRPPNSNLGFVITVDGEIVGFVGTICAQREEGGKSGVVCNCTSWYVRPEYRYLALGLFTAAHRDRTISYTNLTPNEVTSRMLERMGFKALAMHTLILPALFNLETLFASRPVISFEKETVYRHLNEQQRRIFDAHAPYGCLQGVVIDGEEQAYFVAKRRILRPRTLRPYLPPWSGIPVSMILHCSAPVIMARHLERIKLHLLLRHRTCALLTYNHLFAVPPRAIWRSIRTWYRSDIFDLREFDGLYTEFVLLPV